MKELITKNIVLTALLVLLYSPIQSELIVIQNPQMLETLLIFVGLIIIAPIFADFSFTYSHLRNRGGVWLDHFIAFTAMFTTGLLLIMLDILLLQLVGNILAFRIALLLFWVTLVAYDLWDYLRLEHGHKQ